MIKMNIILCVDENMGMLFNKRRQSRDKKVMEDIIQMADTLWIHPFSEKLFQENGMQKVYENDTKQILTDEKFLEKALSGQYCFVENQELMLYSNDIEQIVLYCWNRKYPSDFKLDLDLSKWEQQSVTEFAGSSHEKITKIVYEKAGEKHV